MIRYLVKMFSVRGWGMHYGSKDPHKLWSVCARCVSGLYVCFYLLLCFKWFWVTEIRSTINLAFSLATYLVCLKARPYWFACSSSVISFYCSSESRARPVLCLGTAYIHILPCTASMCAGADWGGWCNLTGLDVLWRFCKAQVDTVSMDMLFRPKILCMFTELGDWCNFILNHSFGFQDDENKIIEKKVILRRILFRSDAFVLSSTSLSFTAVHFAPH